jgi:DNA invertase Pin-like site-specific DNA recombinase
VPRKRKAAPDATRAVGYVRVSTSEQADSGLGLEAQRAAITAECDRRGWQLTEIHEDAGLSGKTLSRPGLLAGLDAVHAGPAGILVVAKLDRLSRSLVDFAGLMARAQREGWNLVALDLGIDLSTPAGEFMANVMSAAAQWERRIIGQRTRDALAAKQAQGTRLGRPTAHDPNVRAQVLAAFRSGTTLSAIARHLNQRQVPTAHGGARWYPSTVRAIVQSEHLTANSPSGINRNTAHA